MTKDVLAAALDSGLAISILVIFFALQFPKNGTVSVASPINNDFALQFYPDWRKQHPCLVGVSCGLLFKRKLRTIAKLSHRNTVSFVGADALGTPNRQLAAGEKFGYVSPSNDVLLYKLI